MTIRIPQRSGCADQRPWRFKKPQKGIAFPRPPLAPPPPLTFWAFVAFFLGGGGWFTTWGVALGGGGGRGVSMPFTDGPISLGHRFEGAHGFGLPKREGPAGVQWG